MKGIGVFANTIAEAKVAAVGITGPADDDRVYHLSPRRVEIGAARGMILDEVHVFGRADEIQAWLAEFILTPSFLPATITATNPKIVLHVGGR